MAVEVFNSYRKLVNAVAVSKMGDHASRKSEGKRVLCNGLRSLAPDPVVADMLAHEVIQLAFGSKPIADHTQDLGLRCLLEYSPDGGDLAQTHTLIVVVKASNFR